MRRLTSAAVRALALFICARVLAAQGVTGACSTPDSLVFHGNTRVSDAVTRQDAGLVQGQPLNSRSLSRAVRNLYNEGQYEDIRAYCETVGTKTFIIFDLKERPVLTDIKVRGTKEVSAGDVQDRVDLLLDHPIDPAQIVRAITRIDSLYTASGYYLAHVYIDSVPKDGGLALTFRISEGPRLSVSGVWIGNNRAVRAEDIVGAMDTKPEGFFWWRKGEIDDDDFATDLIQRLPGLYASKGYIDMQVVADTIEPDAQRGKALIRIQVHEGPKYLVGTFEITGNRHFTDDEVAGYYPFRDRSKTLTQLVKGIVKPTHATEVVFDKEAWESSLEDLQKAYLNDGYLFAQVSPVVERVAAGPDSIPRVNLRWDINEGSPAIINRVDISGNDVTSESCIRDQLFVVPGDVYSYDRLMRSWQSIGNLKFFETPLPEPDIVPSANHENVDITFKVKEKRTGNLNFGASVGQGTGLGGFIGFDQPNLFGLCKQGSIQWQYGQYINNFNIQYTDPHFEGSRISSTISGHHTQSRFTIGDLGESITTGADLTFGFPLAHSRQTRLYTTYSAEQVKYGNTGLVDSIQCNGCWRSSVGATLENDTQIGTPFPFTGSKQSITMQLDGGPLGGSAEFTRYLGEMDTWSTIAKLPGAFGSEPMLVVFGLQMKAGAVFGDDGPFFVSQSFALGGTQYGEQLRGYPEFSITPAGYNPNASEFQAQQTSFGNAFYTSTMSMNLRVTDQLNLDLFYDAGNIWTRPQDFDPTRLFRGAGIGAGIVTPLGPLGVDLGYGFDRTDVYGRPAPAWQVHFKFGQLF